MACLFTDTQFSSAWKRNSQAFEEFACILYFTCKLSNSTPQFPSSIGCTGIDLVLKYPHKKEKSRGFKSGEPSGQETEPACDQFSVQDSFRTVIDALHDCNVVEHRLVDMACEDTRI
jgi:hypothetical protein